MTFYSYTFASNKEKPLAIVEVKKYNNYEQFFRRIKKVF